jgi:LysM repeat protein
MKKNIFVCLLLCCSYNLFAQTARNEYIEKYRDLAMKQMSKSGVPASIILGQACLESNYGKGALATKGKNHFGIKCHRSWTGAKMFLTDDAPDECFRKYPNDEDSFKDHSDFLRFNRRYAFLFDLEPTDYKSWAYGLKKAGYATNSRYAETLIKIIEDNRLYLYDKNVPVTVLSPVKLEKLELDNFVIQLNRIIHTRNDVKYVVANEYDTYESIAEEFKLTKGQLLKYNDLDKNTPIYAGQELYIKPKKKKASINFPMHIVQDGENMYQISQKYAVKLKSLYKYNNMRAGDEPEPEQEIFMRNKMKR